jgi:hypothetical protein
LSTGGVSPRNREILPQSPRAPSGTGAGTSTGAGGAAAPRASTGLSAAQQNAASPLAPNAPLRRSAQRGGLAQRQALPVRDAGPAQAAPALERTHPAQIRSDLQSALGRLKDDNTPFNQTAAHEAVVKYGEHAGTLGDRLLPVFHKAAVVGVAGTSMAFGVGRNTGIATADTAAQRIAGRPRPLGVYAHGKAPAPGLASAGQVAGEWAGGAMLGAVGNVAGEHLVAPAINSVSRQHVKVDSKAIVPDRMVAVMNGLEAGSGDALRAKVETRQADIAGIGSNSNKRIGQVAFDVATAARTAAQGSQQLGFAGTVGIGLAVSAAAGAAIGTTMAIRAARARESVPKMAALEAEVAARQDPNHERKSPGALAQDEIPLFFTQHPEDKNPLKLIGSAVGKAVAGSALRDPAPSREPGDAQAPTRPPLTGGDLANTAISVARRAVLMAKATTITGTATAITPFVAHQMPTPALQSLVRTTGAAIGIHTAIKPWFDALATDIPQGDKRRHEARQAPVDQAYRSALAAQAPSIEMVQMNVNAAAGLPRAAGSGSGEGSPRPAAEERV